MVTGSEQPNLGYAHPSNPISQSSSAAALVALAASGCVGKSFSSQLLQNFQKQSLKKRLSLKGNLSHELSKSDDPPSKKSRQQFDVESLTEKSSTAFTGGINSSQAQQNAILQYGGFPALNASPVHSAWQQLLYRFRYPDFSPEISKDFSPFGEENKFLSSRMSQESNPLGTSFPANSANMPVTDNGLGRSAFFVRKQIDFDKAANEKLNRSPSVDEELSAENQKVNGKRTKDSDRKCISTMTGIRDGDSRASSCEGYAVGNVTEKNALGCGRCSSTSSNQSNSDEPRSRRRKRVGSFADTCPVCGVTVRPSELAAHMRLEIEKLARMPGEMRRRNVNRNSSDRSTSRFFPSGLCASTSTTGKRLAEVSTDSDRTNRLKTYQKVRSNRVERLNTRVGQCLRAQRSLATSETEIAGLSRNPVWPNSTWTTHFQGLPSNCPVCCNRLIGSLSEMHEHIGRCLRQKNANRVMEDEDLEVDVETNELPRYLNANRSLSPHDEQTSNKSFGSEYEWCGQTRVRATALAGSDALATSSGFYVVKPSSPGPESYLNVDTDDTQSYGLAQFSEADLIPFVPNTKRDEDEYASSFSAKKSELLFPHEVLSTSENKEVDTISAFRLKIEQLENEKRITRCMICMETYKDPVTSIQCWHVHCEKCWLRALAVKKLCPQCNAITPPDKLRRIYL
ncbi:uncharacterized protein LOC143460475 isoform X2 [Clavelina lepadiformis]